MDGNRRDYKREINNVKKNPNYIRNYDDDFDCTYAYFEFEIPEKYQHACKMMAPKEERPSLKRMFEKEVEEAGKPGSEASKRMEKIAEQLMDAMENGNHFIGL